MSRRQRHCVVLLGVAAIVLGGIVEWRSVFLKRRMTDVGCYLRAAWAVRVGGDLYRVTDNNNWHYNYPPLLAVLIAPLADAPPGQPQPVAVPYPASVAIWYAASVLAIVLAVHWLATALSVAGLSEAGPRVHRARGPASLRPATEDQPQRDDHRWWALRLLPFLILLPAIGRTLARGQVNLFVVALLAGWIAGMVRGNRFRAGLYLAAAVCIKVIPALLIIHPLWRRDRRCLVGTAVGLVLGLVVIPVAACGPQAAYEQAQTFLKVTLLPGMGVESGDTTRLRELTSINTTDSQSMMTALHNLAHPNPWFRPPKADPWVRRTHWGTAVALLAITLWRFRREQSALVEIRFAGALMVVMTLASPVSHLHYFVFCLPLVASLWAEERPSRGVVSLSAFFVFANVASLLPIDLFRSFGLTTVAALMLWGAAMLTRDRATSVHSRREPAPPLAA
jgi:alpha-1,2-mannosyltransferase